MGSVDQDGGLVVGQIERGVAAPNMTLHHIIPRLKLSLFWNTVKANNHIDYLIGTVENLTTAAIRRNPDALELDLEGGVRLNTAGVETYMNYMHNPALPQPPSQGIAAAAIEKVFQWWPANIHYGPTNRVTPAMRGYDPLRDDGGDNFEVSAQKVVPPEIYSRLVIVNNEIDLYTADNETKHLTKIHNAMCFLARKESTPFNGKKWKKYTIEGREYYRFPQ